MYAGAKDNCFSVGMLIYRVPWGTDLQQSESTKGEDLFTGCFRHEIKTRAGNQGFNINEFSQLH